MKNNLEKWIICLIIFTIIFLLGAVAGGSYVLRELSISQTDTSYIVNYDGHLFEYEKEE